MCMTANTSLIQYIMSSSSCFSYSWLWHCRYAMATSICAFIQSTCSELGYNISVVVICRRTMFHCLCVQSLTVLTDSAQMPRCLSAEPASGWKKSRQRCSERWKRSTFVPTAQRFTGRAAITRKCMRNFHMFCHRTVRVECDKTQLLYTHSFNGHFSRWTWVSRLPP